MGLFDIFFSTAQMMTLVKFRNEKPIVDQESFKMIMRRVGKKPVIIIGVCGELRSGKSFLLEMFRKFLNDEMSLDNPETKLGEPQGIAFQSNDDPHTKGIQIWSEPFFFKPKNEGGKECAVLLVDTQGIYGDDASPQIHNFTLTFMAMFCDILVYNANGVFRMSDFEKLAQTVVVTKQDKKPDQIGYIVSRNLNKELGHRPNFFQRPTIQKNYKRMAEIVEEGFLKLNVFALPEPADFVREASHTDTDLTLGNGTKSLNPKMKSFLQHLKVLFQSFIQDFDVIVKEKPKNQICRLEAIAEKATELTKDPQRNLELLWEHSATRAGLKAESYLIDEISKIDGDNLNDNLRLLNQAFKNAKERIQSELDEYGPEYVRRRILEFEKNFKPIVEITNGDLRIAEFCRFLKTQCENHMNKLMSKNEDKVALGREHTAERELLKLQRREHQDYLFEGITLTGEQELEVNSCIILQDTLIEETFEELMGRTTLKSLRARLTEEGKLLAEKICNELSELGNNYECSSYDEWISKLQVPQAAFTDPQLGKFKLQTFEVDLVEALVVSLIQKVKKDYQERLRLVKAEILNNNPNVELAVAKNIALDIYEQEIMTPIREAIFLFQRDVDAKMQTKLKVDAETSPFRTYMLSCLGIVEENVNDNGAAV